MTLARMTARVLHRRDANSKATPRLQWAACQGRLSPVTGDTTLNSLAARDAKVKLRKRARQQRANIPQAERALFDRRIGDHLLALPELEGTPAVALFWPIEHLAEVDLRPVDERLRQRGCALGYPAIGHGSEHMVFRCLSDTAALVDGGKGFMQPPPDAPIMARLDVILVPGLSFDGSGFRVGYGGGYYDQILPQWPSATAIGVCYERLLEDALPHLRHDVPVDIVVTDERVIRAAV
jgi:5-formyltetrahydrofolate cyclo-ligase